MKKISKLLGILTAMGIMVLFTGCSSTDGQKLADAVIKNADIQTVTSNSEIAFKVNLIGIDMTKEDKQALNIINNISISATTKSDVKNNKLVSDASINLLGINLADGSLYTDKNNSWLKMPDNQKYIELGAAEKGSNSVLSEAKALQIQEQTKKLTVEFFKNYSREYNFAFSDLKNKGTTTLNTPEGKKDVSLIQVKVSNDEFTKLIDYSLKNAAASNSLKNYLKSMLSMAESVEPNRVESNNDEIGNSFNELNKDIDSNSKQFISEFSKYFELGQDGIDITYGIDDQNNIISTESKMDFIIKNQENIGQKVEIELITNSVNYDLNKTVVNIPQFTEENTIKFEDYVKTSPLLKDSPFAEGLGFGLLNTDNSNEISLTIGENRAMVGNGEVEMDAQPYIEGEYTMVPVKFIGDALGAGVEWDGDTKQVIYTDNDKTVVMQIGSKIAYVNGERVKIPIAPVIRNGRTMVPLRFISEQLGARVDWNDNLKRVRIYK